MYIVNNLFITMVILQHAAHFEDKQWKPIEPPFKFPSVEKSMDDHYQGFDYQEEETLYGNSPPTEHTNQAHTEL